MSKYGAKYGRWAPFEGPEPANALPTYGTAVPLGPLNKVTDNPSFASSDLYGDNALKHHKDKFSRAAVEYTSTNLPLTSAAAIYGATIDEDNTQVDYGNDNPPLGGLAFFCELDDEVSGKTVYRGIFYPKLRAVMTGEEFNTTGETLTFDTDVIQFTAQLPNAGPWKRTKDFDTEEAAKAWVDSCFIAAAA